jgi:hypothetical protein
LYAQKDPGPIRFKNGEFRGSFNSRDKRFSKDFMTATRFRRKLYTLIQFDQLPTAAEKRELQKAGIVLSGYLPGNAFYAELNDNITPNQLVKYRITGMYKIGSQYKIARRLQQHINQGILATGNDRPVAVHFFGTIEHEEVLGQLQQLGARIVPVKMQMPGVLFINASAQTLLKIANLPFINYLDQQTLTDVPLNYNNRGIHSLDALSASSGRNLQGRNVTIGIGDDANPSSHIDFTGRLIVRTPDTLRNHGTHTTGTAAGGGILNPLYKGMAPKATIVSQTFSDIISYADTYLLDYNMMLTSNSYFTGDNFCPGDGEYNFLSQYTDYQLNFFPTLLHVFAAGNDGALNCSPYTTPYGTIKSGFQCAKNVLTVGNMNNSTYIINAGSSAGPVNDGRLKPEIVAGGTSITSTLRNNSYGGMSGTSMACPTVAGTLALLYEKYRQLNSNSDPSGALIKAIACNSADDLGRPGPDFLYGFGMLNARKAVEAIEQSRYITGTIANAGTGNFSISVPAGAHQLKVMLYWSDPYAALSASTTLVNDLDLTVTTPSPITIHKPLILNPSVGTVTNDATEGVDTLNNIEQVVIGDPDAGSYTITVNGTSIPAGTQGYIITYEVIMPSVTVEYPFGNETLVPGATEKVRWTAYGGDGNTFTIEYSDNNGNSWTTIDGAVSSTARSYSWTVPSTATNQGLIRVTRNIADYKDTSNYEFTILGQPTLTVTNPCQGYAQLDWPTITSATSYDIMMLKGDSMSVVANTISNTYLLEGLNKDSSYWLSVRAVNGSTPGRRAVAQNIQPNSGACTLSSFDNDLSIDSLLAPVTGRKNTLSQLGTTAPQVRLQNLGNLPTSGSFTIAYQVNGGSILSELISPAMVAHSSTNIMFTNVTDFSTPGTYTIKAWVEYSGDLNHANDTVITVIKQLQNNSITLAPSFTEGFETATSQSYTAPTMGFDGLDRCDFNRSNTNGRARTFVNTGFERTGNRCITLDQIYNKYKSQSTADSLITTFNLSSYTTASHQIDLTFYYQNRGIDTSLTGNQVWIRGSETATWIPVFTLPIGVLDIGLYHSATVNVTSALAGAAQNFSSSFQVKFGEQGFKSSNAILPSDSTSLDNGVSYDDITFTLSTPLPLTLQSFTASKVNTTAALKWTTAQEIQTDKFIIEKSGDGISYVSIGTVQAVGNSTSEVNYTFIDHTPVNGANYYRLKMIDIDGKYTYSEVRTLTFDANGLTIVVYPNPVKDGIVYINTSAPCNRIELRDITGRVIKIINVQGAQHTVSLSGLTPGTYFISVMTLNGKKVQKVVVE